MRLEEERARIGRVLGQRAFAAGFLVTGVLVLAWPFVRAPRFHLVPAYVHVLVAWALVIVGLAAMSWALARAEREPGGDEDERRG